jgi:hypothetical protein
MLGQYIVYNNQIFHLDNQFFSRKKVFVPGQRKIPVETGQNSNLYFVSIPCITERSYRNH